MKKTLLVLALVAMAAPDRASGQSFLGFRGLGVPVGVADGRSVALGNLGIGLARAGLSVSDPAAAFSLKDSRRGCSGAPLPQSGAPSAP